MGKLPVRRVSVLAPERISTTFAYKTTFTENIARLALKSYQWFEAPACFPAVVSGRSLIQKGPVPMGTGPFPSRL